MLTPSQLASAHQLIALALTDFVREYDSVSRNIQDGKRGLGAAALSPTTTGGDPADPTAAAAFTPDEAAAAEDEVTRLVTHMAACARRLDLLRWTFRYVVPKSDECSNPNGCPARRKAAPGRKLCDGCRKHRERYGEHRTSIRGGGLESASAA